ncbi:MAG: hypothetical protein PHO63_04680 [Bacilli bacterium]|nr:hypothetical protein [Bacilli bacterium]MDD4808581.1 hypothetical protein [Bacilli bacterium]
MKSDVFKKELSYIKDEKIRLDAIKLINLLPDYFFVIQASSSGKYHPQYAVGEGGLVRHTKVAVKLAYDLLENNTIGSAFTDREKDLMLVSLLMHDGLKEGLVKEEYTIFEHPLLIGDYIKKNASVLSLTKDDVELVTNMITSHMGEWNTNKYSKTVLPLPENKYQKFVHMCDYLASRKFLNVEFNHNDIID